MTTIPLHFVCSCKTKGGIKIQSNLETPNCVFITDCSNCKNTIVVIVNEIDAVKKNVRYTVQIRQTEQANY